MGYAPAASLDPRAAELIDDIDRIIEQGDPATIQTRLQGIIQTFGEAAWARPAVERARQELQSTVQSQSNSNSKQPSSSSENNPPPEQ